MCFRSNEIAGCNKGNWSHRAVTRKRGSVGGWPPYNKMTDEVGRCPYTIPSRIPCMKRASRESCLEQDRVFACFVFTPPQSGCQSTDLLKPEAKEWSCCINARNVETLRRIGTGDVKADVEWPTESCSHIRLASEIDLAKA